MLASDLRQKSEKDLLKLIDDLKAELFMLRFQNSTGQLEQPHKIKLIKKDIARVFSVLNNKEFAKAKEAKDAAKKAPAKATEEKGGK